MRPRLSQRISLELLFVLAFGYNYILTPTKMYYIDGVFYAEHLENMPWHLNAFHPHHLLYLPMAHLFYSLVRLMPISIRAMTFLQFTNAIFGALTLWIFLLILKRYGFGLWTRIFAITLLGSAYTFWHHATDADIYIPAHFLFMCVLYLVLSSDFFTSWKKQVWTGLLYAFAVLVHQITLIGFIPIAIYIIALKKKSFIGTILRFATPFIVLIVASYISVFMMYHGDTPATKDNFSRWVGAFGRAEHYFSFTEKYNRSPIEVFARGHTNAFFPLRPLEKILYTEKSGDTNVSYRLYRFILALTLISVLINVFITMKLKSYEAKWRGYLALLLFIFYFAFTFVFMPENHFYRIFYLPPLIIIWIGIFISLGSSYRKVIKPIIAVILLIFYVSNCAKGIIPEMKTVNNPYLALTKRLDKVVRVNDVIIFAPKDRYFTGIYRYFGKGDALHLQTGKHFMDREKMLDEIDKYEAETISMLQERYDKIYIMREASETGIDPMIFTPNNYRLPHPKFMIARRDKFEFVRWRNIGNHYFAEIRIKE